MAKKTVLNLLILWSLMLAIDAASLELPESWDALKPVLTSRVYQPKPKMKLTELQAASLAHFLQGLKAVTPELSKLQTKLPKTTLELLRSVHERKVPLEETEKMAQYLQSLLEKLQLQNSGLFDENTSHIIGRDWAEIDYSGEGMTWEKQREKYKPHGITNFKTLENISKFFPLESRLPYFNKIYRPKNPGALGQA